MSKKITKKAAHLKAKQLKQPKVETTEDDTLEFNKLTPMERIIKYAKLAVNRVFDDPNLDIIEQSKAKSFFLSSDYYTTLATLFGSPVTEDAFIDFITEINKHIRYIESGQNLTDLRNQFKDAKI